MMPLPTVELQSRDGARATVAPHGAHVLAWHPAGSDEDHLFLSATSAFRAGTAIRGGVPVVFPQFADRGPLPKHGFARTLPWTVVDQAGPTDDGRARVRLGLTDGPETRALWPHGFAAELTVTVGGATLEVVLAVENRGPAPFAFTGALHSYLRVADVARTGVHGLRGVRYLDSTDGGRERVEEDEMVAIRGEVDRIYLDAPARLTLRAGDRAVLAIEAVGFRDAVVWNPGAEKAAALADLEPGGERRFVCVEAAAVAVPVELAPGEHWTGTQTLTAVAR